MKLSTNPDALRQTRWYEYAIRFAFGGSVTVMTGIIAAKYGPVVGGLFLAFPSIFPASVSLVEKHKKEKMQRDGKCDDPRAKKLAAVDAAGAALGSIGLLGFALVIWFCSASLPAWVLLALATLAWAVIAFVAWIIRQRI